MHSNDGTRTVALTFCHLHFEGIRPLPEGYPTELNTIGDHIRKRRLDLGLVQKEVAGCIGVTVCTINNWELGHAEPKACYAAAVARFLERVDQADEASLLSSRALA